MQSSESKLTMQFQVPQFVEVEDKIFGPLTALQFAYLAGGIGFAFAMWLLLPFWLAIIIGAPVAGLGLALAFYKYNDRPLIHALEAAFEYFVRAKLYIWQKKQPKTLSADDIDISALSTEEDPAKYVPAATSNRIKDLAWSLDIKESIYSKKDQR